MANEASMNVETMDEEDFMNVDKKDFSKQDFKFAYTSVFWDVDDYPIPQDVEPRCISRSIILALAKMGYHGCFREINAYGEKEISEDESAELIDEGSINYNPGPGGSACPMILDMLLRVWIRALEPQNLMVISKKFLQDKESLRVLCALKSRGCNVLLVQPDEAASGSLFHTPDSISDCTRFLNGENPVDQTVDNGGEPMDQIVNDTYSSTSWETDTNPYTDAETDDDPDADLDADPAADPDADPAAYPAADTDAYSDHPAVLAAADPDADPAAYPAADTDAYSDHPAVLAAADLAYGGCKTGVFWDFDDSPFPTGLDPPSIYQTFESALEARRYFGEMSIWAYAEKIPNGLLDEYRKARIYFITGGDKNTRFNRMIHDILLWEMATPLELRRESNVIVISKNVGFIQCLDISDSRGYNSLFVEPNDCEKPKTSAWPVVLLDGAKPVSSFHRGGRRNTRQ